MTAVWHAITVLKRAGHACSPPLLLAVRRRRASPPFRQGGRYAELDRPSRAGRRGRGCLRLDRGPRARCRARGVQARRLLPETCRGRGLRHRRLREGVGLRPARGGLRAHAHDGRARGPSARDAPPRRARGGDGLERIHDRRARAPRPRPADLLGPARAAWAGRR